MRAIIALCALLALAGSKAAQSLRLPVALSSNMVLQRAPGNSVIWGWTAPNTMVTAKIAGQSIDTRSNANGEWTITFNPVDATWNNPQTLTITDTAGGAITLTNILFGDVILCSGQSNMQFTVSQAFNASTEIADSVNYPNLRVFSVAQNASYTPLDDVASKAPYQWGVSSPKVIGGPDWQYFSASCYFFGRGVYKALGDIPVGLVDSDWGGTYIQAWSSPDALSKCNQTESEAEAVTETDDGAEHKDWSYFAVDKSRVFEPSPNTPSVLWNAMIHPLLNMRFAGAAWYQGEANEGAAQAYSCQFPAMISDWREKFDLSLPFYFVQLAPWIPADGASGLFPELRWAQTFGLQEFQTGMAVAGDSGDPGSPYGSIHPRFKQVVGARLAANALAIQYGMNVPYQGAAIQSVAYPNANSTAAMYSVTFVFAATKLELRGTEYCEECCDAPDTFQLRDPTSMQWVSATPTLSGNTLVVSAELSGAPVQVQYAWFDYPECMLYNENHLPTPEFQMYLASQ